MRTYLTYLILGLIGFILLKLTGIELNLITTLAGLISIPIIEYLINIKYHKRNALLGKYESTELTKPQSFGFKSNWIAVKSNDIKAVLDTYKHTARVQTNWDIGVNATFENRELIFVSPPVDDWILIINNSLGYINSNDTISTLNLLSKAFGEAYSFGSFRGTNYGSWSKYMNGEEVRAYLIDDGEVYYSKGDPEKTEYDIINQRKSELNKDDKDEWEYHEKYHFENLLGTEEDVLMMAEEWTINPMTLNKREGKELGYLIKELD